LNCNDINGDAAHLSLLIFERTLIISVDKDKDGHLDFKEITEFMMETNRTEGREQAE